MWTKWTLRCAVGAALIFVVAASAHAQQNPIQESNGYIYQDGQFYYVRSVPQPPVVVSVPGLRLIDRASLENHEFPIQEGPYDLQQYLIDNDLARLTTPSEAPDGLRRADAAAEERSAARQRATDAAEVARREAEKARVAREAEQRRKLWASIESGGAAFINFVVDIFPGLFGFSVLTAMIFLLRHRFVRVIAAGEVSSGKTSVLLRLTSDSVLESDVLDLKPTMGVKHLDGLKKIPAGGITYRARFVDVAGTKPGKNIGFSGRPIWWVRFFDFWVFDVLLVVLAPAFEKNATHDDPGVVREQLGYVKGLVAALVQRYGPKRLRLVQVFINKADLVQPGGDFVSDATVTRVREMFAAHIRLIEGEANGVPVDIVIGSALKGWNTSGLGQRMGERIRRRK